MASKAECDSLRQEPDLEVATRRRLERDLRLAMSERLARAHALCKQMTAIAGAARRK
jgi:hypothetical protein